MSTSKSPPTALGQYLILEELGAGSFARVYRCEHMFTHEKFAGKLYEVDFAISEEGCKLLRKEISILKLLRHPHVIRFQEVVSNRSWMLIVMELVEGRTLLNVMPPSGGLPESFARPVIKQILDAVVFLHCNGVVHRDIKLENVMIQKDGTVKIIDFGLADHVPEGYTKEGLLIEDQCGSPHYYSPEMILAGKGHMFRGDKVDIWAIGVLLFSLTTGYHPFYSENNDNHALFRQIVSEEVLFENGMSKGLEHLLKRILVKDPSKRATLHEVWTHPWTNNTFLTHEVDDWILNREREKAHSRPALTSFSVQNDCLQRKADGLVVMSSEDNYISTRIAPTPPQMTISKHNIDNRRKRSSNTGNHKFQNREKQPRSTERCKTLGSIGFGPKLLKRMKDCLKELVQNSKKSGLCHEKHFSLSEELNSSVLAINGDDSRKGSVGNREGSGLFASALSMEGRKLDKGKDSRRTERICKMSFACWINV